jgi:hypothetical protein
MRRRCRPASQGAERTGPPPRFRRAPGRPIDGGGDHEPLVEINRQLLTTLLDHGNPEESLNRVLRYLSKHKDSVIIKGVGATGSARKLYEKILLSKSKAEQLAAQGVTLVDRITDEITCHALGVKHNNPDVDTIFEVGGQDMKFTCFGKDGTVKEAKMNYSCQAGSGQTLENMADVINLNVESTLQEAALRAERVPIIDSTCGVFMEMDENRLIAEGFSRDEIAAAITRGTAASYYYKFVGGAQHSGNKCSAQGGPALGTAFLAALAQVTDKEIEAYPHREMFGAWGQALDIIENLNGSRAKQAAPPFAAGRSSTWPSTSARSCAGSSSARSPAACATASSKSSVSRTTRSSPAAFARAATPRRSRNPKSIMWTVITRSMTSTSRSRGAC